jgi:hypothetical protein
VWGEGGRRDWVTVTTDLGKDAMQRTALKRAALQHAEKTRRNGNSARNGQHCTMRKRQDIKFQMQQTARWDATDSISTCRQEKT